jgi:hypothetical protein
VQRRFSAADRVIGIFSTHPARAPCVLLIGYLYNRFGNMSSYLTRVGTTAEKAHNAYAS